MTNGGQDIAAELSRLVSDERRVTTGESVRRLHGEPWVGNHVGQWPDVVVFPDSTEEVSAILAFADANRISVVPYGAGSSANGATVPTAGGISLDLTNLTSIDVRPSDLQATVGAGVTRLALADAAGQHGLWFPVDPGADATLGGMAATNASGTTTVRYGSMRQNVLEVKAVLPGGRVVRAGTRTVKTSAAYNLAHLLIGSEGTLGVITELTLRLYGIPEHVVAIRAAFAELDSACACATALVASGIGVLRVELVDPITIDAVNSYKELDLPVVPHLFIELGGSPVSVSAELAEVQERATEFDCLSFDSTSDHTERARLWTARHDAGYAIAAANPGKKVVPTDTTVPLSQVSDAVRYAQAVMDGEGYQPIVLGHVGDGTYHCTFMVDDDDPAEPARVNAAVDDIVRDCLARGGTCSGENGIGMDKIGYLEQEHGDLVPLLRGVKSVFDPNGIMNPGKLFTPA